MKRNHPIYMYQCVVCRVFMYTENTHLLHCKKLTQWIAGIEGKGLDMNSPIVKIKVSGYITMTKENLDRMLAYEDPHTGLVYSLHMGYVDTDNLDFEVD